MSEEETATIFIIFKSEEFGHAPCWAFLVSFNFSSRIDGSSIIKKEPILNRAIKISFQVIS